MTASLLILARASHYGGGMMLVGVVAFRWLFLLPAFAGETDETWRRFAPLLARLNGMFIGSGIALILSGLAMFWAVAAGMSNTSLTESLNAETLGTVFFQTQFGSVFQWRLGLAVLMAILAWRLVQSDWQFQRRISKVEMAAGIIAVALMVSFAWTGHAAASGGPDYLPRIAADALHLFATSIWPTGLLPLAMFLACARGMEDGFAFAPALRLVQRFSNVSLAIVAILVATGLTNSYFTVGRFRALFTTTYGHVLCVKLLLFAAILGVAAFNRCRIAPILSATSEAGAARPLFRRLQHLVLTEFTLAVAIVAVVSVLGTTPPPQQRELRAEPRPGPSAPVAEASTNYR